jgi:hypothetical protein
VAVYVLYYIGGFAVVQMICLLFGIWS